MPYSDKVLDHYNNPRNKGSLDKADPNVGTGIVGAPECGDVMKLQIKINPETGMIEDAKFKTFGCGSAIASSSLATEWMKGRHLDDAFAIRNDSIVEELSLPPVKVHCSVLAEDAIKAAVVDLAFKRMPADVLEYFAADLNKFRFVMVDVRRECGSDIARMVESVRSLMGQTDAAARALPTELAAALTADAKLRVVLADLVRKHTREQTVDTAAVIEGFRSHVEAANQASEAAECSANVALPNTAAAGN